MDPSGSTTPAAMTFYKRAKALYDANYEDDRVTIVQSLVLMGWYWEGPEGLFIIFAHSEDLDCTDPGPRCDEECLLLEPSSYDSSSRFWHAQEVCSQNQDSRGR